MGDMQEKNGFIGLNSLILKDAEEILDINVGPRFFGMQTRPINKVLEYCTDPFIPNVTGSSEGAIKFLDDLGIKKLPPDIVQDLYDILYNRGEE